ncbi:MAG: hypothetical protein AVDCRST_MAG57-3602 [uncultured Blastococcus sp.]|uniref:DUF2029 domain-containing protein n=1 Tax=uncultured Blastococcus sp. TaxID=217144 RepID=A0A6J4JF43_9ACTN|nr:MAG: hypothetical protein AVDCRST_MAG57-3602 [uncultured Blastococcus sp.]
MRRLLLLAASSAVFLAYNVHHWWNAPGDDWSSIWVAASMVRRGQADLIYTIDPNRFTDVGDPVAWLEAARAVGRETLGHPYVHEPGLAYFLSLFAGPGSWLPSLHVLLVISLLSTLGIVWLVGRMWAPVLLQPVPFAVVLLAVTLSEPFRYGLFLGQTTPVILLLTLGAVVLARRHPVLAGALLALPVSIKITPILIALWWVLDRERRKALIGLAAGLVGLAAVQLAFIDRTVVEAFVAALRHVQRTTTTGYSNQSLVAWLVDFSVSEGQNTYPTRTVPTWVSLVSTGLLLVFVAAVLYRAHLMRRAGTDAEPFAIAGLLLAPLPFTPLSWTHYYLLLLVPTAVLVTAARRGGRHWPYLVVAAFIALSMQPLAVNGPANLASPDALIRSHLLSGLLALLALMAIPQRVWPTRVPAPDGDHDERRNPDDWLDRPRKGDDALAGGRGAVSAGTDR